MKSKKNKILAATACGVIVTSIGASFLFNKPNEDKAEDIKKDKMSSLRAAFKSCKAGKTIQDGCRMEIYEKRNL